MQGRQKDFVDAEQRLGRSGGEVSAVVGYAGGTEAGAHPAPAGLACSGLSSMLVQAAACRTQLLCVAKGGSCRTAWTLRLRLTCA